jgi:hypothetical protein
MRIFGILIFNLLCLSGCSQERESTFELFVNSFDTMDANEVIEFRSVFYKAEEMSKDDAIKYIYNNDSTKLYCKEEIFNMETEKVEGYSTNIFLPKKLLKLRTADYILISYSTQICPDLSVHDVTEAVVILKILNLKYQIMDSIIVYKEKYDYSTRAILNPKTGKLFLISSDTTRSHLEASLIRINPKTLKFEIMISPVMLQPSYDNPLKEVERLGWNDQFMK